MNVISESRSKHNIYSHSITKKGTMAGICRTVHCSVIFTVMDYDVSYTEGAFDQETLLASDAFSVIMAGRFTVTRRR